MLGEFEKRWTKAYPDSNLEEEIKNVKERRKKSPIYGYLYQNKKKSKHDRCNYRKENP